jgi:hypothetical protein
LKLAGDFSASIDGSVLALFAAMNNTDRDNENAPEPNVDANTRDENQHKPEQQGSDTSRVKGQGAAKGTDIAATTDAEYAEREKGKRTTM